jgi:hypothetical protein
MFRFRLVNTITDLLMALSFVVYTLGVTLLGPSSLAPAESSKALARFALVDVTRDPGGNPELTPEGQLVSSNWSGYALPNFQTGDVYTSVQASFHAGLRLAEGSIGLGEIFPILNNHKPTRSLEISFSA